MTKGSGHYAIVTGASSGLGKALAEELAQRGHNLLLVSLPGTGLSEQAGDLAARHGVEARFIETDLMRAEAPGEIRKFVADQNLGIDLLVNNVGIGHGGAVGEYSDAAIEESVFLNMRCTTLMTNAFIEELKQRERSYILNMGSFGGFLPMPHKSIYAATKAYIYHYSLAIGEELNGSRVSVSVAMPGPILTNSHVRERISRMGFLAKSNVLDAEGAAAYIVKKMYRGSAVIIPRWTIRISYGIGSCLPYKLLMVLLRKIFRGID